MGRAAQANRRGFLVTGLLAAAGCAARSRGEIGGTQPGGQEPPPSDELARDLARLESAQELAGLSFTGPERAQMLGQLDGQLSMVSSARQFEAENHFAPALVFDPRLPGTVTPREAKFEPAKGAETKAPRDPRDLAFAPLTDLSQWLRRGEVTSTQLTKLYLERLGRLGPSLECTVTLMQRSALAQAQTADREISRGQWRGPLHGVPWGAKDLLDTQGVKTTWGAAPYSERVPGSDAAVVRRLHAAGAVLTAKLSLGALAYGDRWFGGRTRNPWNLAEGSSGSSAGSAAAVSAGLVGFALGTETLGSIVSPSTRCGATGLRPTFGRVSRAGAMVVAWSMDKIGPICRRTEDTALVLAAIEGVDPNDPSSRDVPLAYRARSAKGMRVVYDPEWFAEANPPQVHARDALAAQGVELVARTFPEQAYSALLLCLYAEAAAAFETLTFDGLDDELSWQDDIAWPNRLRLSRLIPAADCVQADRLRRRSMEIMRDYLAGFDASVSPSFAGPLLTVSNFTGHPSLTLPVGFENKVARDIYGRPLSDAATGEGAPVRVPTALTLWGPLYREDKLWNLGRALESALGVAMQRPPNFDS